MSRWNKDNTSEKNNMIKNDENIRTDTVLKVGLLEANAITVIIINTSGSLIIPKIDIFIGKVINDKSDKTVIVLVKRRYSHPFFGKVITSSKKYHVHDEKNKFKIGDDVKIIESKPFSKKKRWEAISK